MTNLIKLIHMPQWNISQPPMGISYIGAYLRHKGLNVKLYDFSIELYDSLSDDLKYIMDAGDFHINWIHENDFKKEVLPKIGNFIDDCFEQIIADQPKILGFSVLTTNILPTLMLIEKVKEKYPKIPIILGGPFVTRYEGGPETIKNPNIDFIIPDEGEETSYELINALLNNETNFSNIKGLLFEKDGELIDTGSRELIEDINNIPYPVYTDFPLEKYKTVNIPILGSRGCIFKCTFCSETVLWKRFRYRTAQNIFEEMKYHLENFNTRAFYIVDSLINGNMKELEKLCHLIIESGIEIHWGGKASIRIQMTKDFLDLMAKAGCNHLYYGIESGSPKVIRDMRKGFTVDIAKRVLKDTYHAGIHTGAFFLIGFPTETEKHYEETKQFLADVEIYLDSITAGFGMGILPGSEVYYEPEKFGIKWHESGEWYSDAIGIEERKHRIKDFRVFCERLNVIMD